MPREDRWARQHGDMRSVPPRGSVWVLFAITPRGFFQHFAGSVSCIFRFQTHPLPRGGTDFMGPRLTNSWGAQRNKPILPTDL